MKTYLSKLLATNDPPSEDVMLEINGLMATPSQELAEIDQRIVNLEAQLQLLQKRRQKIENLLQEYRTIMSPIRRLPNDVLHEIFYHCLPSHRNPILSATEAPILLTRISSRWRSIAFSSPSLWAQLHISFCDDYSISVTPNAPSLTVLPHDIADIERRHNVSHILNKRANGVKDWLLRSGTCPLSISFLYTTSHSGDLELEAYKVEDNPTTKLLKTILSHSHHLKSLELVMPTEIYRQLDNMMSSKILWVLTDLKASFICPPQRHIGRDTIVIHEANTLFSAPHLQHVSLDGYPAYTVWALETLPLAGGGKHMKYFYSHLLHSRNEIFNLLKECENLVDCTLHIGPSSDGTETPIHGVAFLPKLRKFTLSDGDNNANGAIQFYSSIEAPHLRWIDFQSRNYGAYTYPILHLLKNSMELRKLTLDPRTFTDEALHDILQAVSPTLTHLIIGEEAVLRTPRVNRPDWSPGYVLYNFEFLVVDQDSNLNLLPNLNALELSAGWISDGALLRIITSRMDSSSSGSCAALKLVRVIFNRPKELYIEKEVDQYRQYHMAKIGGHPNNVQLDLEYDMPAAPVTNSVPSSSFGLENGRFWPHVDLDEPVRDS